MSLDGGFDEFAEFFSNRARRASNSAILRFEIAHWGHLSSDDYISLSATIRNPGGTGRGSGLNHGGVAVCDN